LCCDGELRVCGCGAVRGGANALTFGVEFHPRRTSH